MEVILLERVGRFGQLGDKVQVKPGFARNYLIPKGMALPATSKNLAEFEERRAALERQEAEAMSRAEKLAAALEDTELLIRRKAGTEGRLFGSVNAADVAQALAESGHEIARQQLRMPDEGIRRLGTYTVAVRIHSDIKAMISVVVEEEEPASSS
ncbi:50S ribosomal protein L9 [Thioalkalivibrio sp. HK1]|uniref:50S ribosomal protein L9 n=1 Tax=Thioalkalivibrio sp. HK1 TaxID=1469245 RepID=UPI00046E6BAE|nr:50S ribosomal protein L9 [Thioalkalivibrio sp. HK1]